jgi:hypothetical protein
MDNGGIPDKNKGQREGKKDEED